MLTGAEEIIRTLVLVAATGELGKQVCPAYCNMHQWALRGV